MKDKNESNYQISITDDGSDTYFSKLYGEHCHSSAGAKTETLYHYIEGCKIAQRLKHENPFRILEVGFGTGLGYLLTKEIADESERKIEFVSFEIDLELIRMFEQKYQLQFEQRSKNTYTLSEKWIELKVLLGNAREQVKAPLEKFHAIYQDAFSPRRNAILWTSEWFKDLYHLSHKNCIMSTYSASSSIRKSMIAAGWKISTGGKFGEKRDSTRAFVTGQSQLEILEKLKRSPVKAITDENYLDYNLASRGKDEKN